MTTVAIDGMKGAGEPDWFVSAPDLFIEPVGGTPVRFARAHVLEAAAVVPAHGPVRDWRRLAVRGGTMTAIGLALAACGTSDNGNNAGAGIGVQKGPLVNARAFADLNNDGVADANEFVTLTDENGEIPADQVANFGSADILIVTDENTFDAVTGEAVQPGLVLSAPNGSTVVTPLTTLVEQIAEQLGGDDDAAEQQVRQALGLGNNVDLRNFNAFNEADDAGNRADALQVIEAAEQIAAVALAFENLSGVEGSNEQAFQAIAALIQERAGLGQTVDLADPGAADIRESLERARDLVPEAQNIDDAVLAAVADVVQDVNEILANAAANDQDPSSAQGRAALAAVTGNLADAVEQIAGLDPDDPNFADDVAGVQDGLAQDIADNEDGFGQDTPRNLTGTDGDDTLLGGLVADRLDGAAGDDSLLGNSGADVLVGGTGADTLLGEDGDDTLRGGAGEDLLNGGSGNDTADFSALTSATTVDLLAGTAVSGGETDTLISIENLVTGSADDIVTGSAVANSVQTGAGNDVVAAAAGNDTVRGGAGDDTLSGGDGLDLIRGDEGDDRIDGDAGRDRLFGGAGDDTLRGGTGNDELDGGDGIDLGDFSQTTVAVDADLTRGTALQDRDGTVETDQLARLENLDGGALDDTLRGDAGDNVLSGGAGDDSLIATAGTDTLAGGDGLDLADFSDLTDALDIDLDAGVARVGPPDSAIAAILDNIEATRGGTGDDTLRGGDGPDGLRGGAGADGLLGGSGNDLLVADGGADVLNGGAGDDLLVFFANDGAEIAAFGGSGADHFAFLPPSPAGTGIDIDLLIADFSGAEGDRLDLSELRDAGGNVLTVDDVLAAASEQDGDAVIAFDGFRTADGADAAGRVRLLAIAPDQLTGNHLVLDGPGHDGVIGGFQDLFDALLPEIADTAV